MPTFDWANKFGDWNVPQFNNFYQYDPDVGAGSYVSFKDAIGTSWTEKNTRFLDDSMWLGYANNRFEYKGDIWHPQAPTKTYDELSGVFGFGGMIKNQGDWAHGAGFGSLYGDDNDHNARHPYYYDIWPQEGMTGIHAISRYDRNPDTGAYGMSTSDSIDGGVYQRTPFHPHMQFRNRYGYAPGNMYNEWAGENQKKQESFTSFRRTAHPFRAEYNESASNFLSDFFLGGQHYYDYNYNQDPILAYNNIASKDFSSEIGFCGPGGAFLWSAPHDYGRMGAVSSSFTMKKTNSRLHTDAYTADLNIQRIIPPSIFWKRPAEWGTMHRPHPGQDYSGSGYVEKGEVNDLGVFYNNQTTPWDGLRLDDKRRNASRLGFGGGPGTKQRFPHSDLYGNVLDALDINDYIDSTNHGRSDMAIYGTYPFNALDSSPYRIKYEDMLPLGEGRRSRYHHGIEQHDLLTFDREPSWTEPQTGYNGHKDSFVVSRWYTYPGATFSYDVSNFSGPSHYDAWYKNDQTEEVQDYKRRDYPQLYEGGWGNYGYFPTQEQLDQGKGATRLFPDPHVATGGLLLEEHNYFTSKDFYNANPIDRQAQSYRIQNLGGYGSHPYNAPAPVGESQYTDGLASNQYIGKYNRSIVGGPNMIFKKTAVIAVDPGLGSSFPLNKYFETPLADYGPVGSGLSRWPIRAYFAPNHKHLDKHVSRTFGIPNEIAGDYYAASRRHNERYGHPDAVSGSYGSTQTSEVAQRDTFLGMVAEPIPVGGTSLGNTDKWKLSETTPYTHLDEYEYKIHSKEGFNTVSIGGSDRPQPPFSV